MTIEEYTQTAPPSSSDPTALLTRSNLLRLETSELLDESTLRVRPPRSGHVGEERARYEARWSPAVRKYLRVVKEALSSAASDGARLSPDVCEVNHREDDGIGGSGEERRYRVPLHSDKFAKHARGERWEFVSPSAYALRPVGSFGHIGNAGLTDRHANGNVVPVLDVVVLTKGEGFVGGKDYLNGRYADVSMSISLYIDRVSLLS